MAIAITLPEDYGYVLLTALTLAFECTMIGFVIGGGSRKLFNQNWMDANFGKDHKEAFGEDSKPSP